MGIMFLTNIVVSGLIEMYCCTQVLDQKYLPFGHEQISILSRNIGTSAESWLGEIDPQREVRPYKTFALSRLLT